jgi:hypothetical protein
MSFDLEGKGGHSRWSNAGWPEVLSLAESYGWKPAGTAPPKGVRRTKWNGAYDDGGYHTNDGQLVTAADAAALAEALQKGLKDRFKRVVAERKKRPKHKVTEEERAQAFEKMARLSSGTTFEVVEHPQKPGGKPTRVKLPSKGKKAQSMEDLLAAQGIRFEDLPSLLTALTADPNAPDDQPAWFTTDEGRSLIEELITFCRAGQFRIE